MWSMARSMARSMVRGLAPVALLLLPAMGGATPGDTGRAQAVQATCTYAPGGEARALEKRLRASLRSVVVDRPHHEASGRMGRDFVFVKWWDCDRRAHDVWLVSLYPPHSARDREYWQARLGELAEATLGPAIRRRLEGGTKSLAAQGREYRVEASPQAEDSLDALVLDGVESVTVRINWVQD